MSLSSFSLIIGVYCYVFGFPFVFSDKHYTEWCKKVLKDPNTLRVVGMVGVMIAALTLKRQWHIRYDAEGFIVLVAWLTFVKCLFAAWWPVTFSRAQEWKRKTMYATPASQAFMGFVMVLLGALFTYIGILLP